MNFIDKIQAIMYNNKDKSEVPLVQDEHESQLRENI